MIPEGSTVTALAAMSYIVAAMLFLFLLIAGAVRVRRGLATDTSRWTPAHGTVADRREYDRGGRRQVAVTVTFSTLDGRRVWFTDDLASGQIGVGPNVPVLYDPLDPLRARVIRRSPVR